jgi:hypothetical protein
MSLKFTEPTDETMSLPKWREDWVMNTGVVGVIVIALVLVVLSVFLYVVPLSQGRATVRPGNGQPVAAAPGPGTTAPVLPSPAVAGAPERYTDPRYAFDLAIPAGWRRAAVTDEARPALAADYDVVWEQPDTGARIAVSAWDARTVTSFLLWSALLGAGMQSADGQTPTNAIVAGRPALLLWAPETPTTPARLAVFLARGNTYYRIAYTAYDGDAAVADYARALATLHWPGDAASTLVLPLRGLPNSRYWPSERLYGR